MAYQLPWRLKNIPRLKTLGRRPDAKGNYPGWPRYWFAYNDYLIDVVIASAADPTRASIDVGCHRGRFTGWLATCSSRVYAFDPDTSRMFDGKPASWKTHLPWAQENPSSTVLQQVAIGDQPGTLEYHEAVTPNGSAASGWNSLLESHHEAGQKLHLGQSRQVEVERLDDLVTEPVGFIKVDAEGYDIRVLQGATRILQEHRPVVIVECSKEQRPGLINLFNDVDYQIWPLGWPLETPSTNPNHYMLNMLAIPREARSGHILQNVNALVRFVENLMEQAPTRRAFARIKIWLGRRMETFRSTR